MYTQPAKWADYKTHVTSLKYFVKHLLKVLFCHIGHVVTSWNPFHREAQTLVEGMIKGCLVKTT